MKEQKDRFIEIEEEYDFLADTSNQFKRRMQSIRRILEHIVDYFFLDEGVQNEFDELNVINGAYNDELKRLNSDEKSKFIYFDNFGGKHRFLIYVSKDIDRKFTGDLRDMYSDISELGSHATLKQEDRETLILTVFRLNKFISWFYEKKLKRRCTFIKDPLNFIELTLEKSEAFKLLKAKEKEIFEEKEKLELKIKSLEKGKQNLEKSRNKDFSEFSKIKKDLSIEVEQLKSDKIDLLDKISLAEESRFSLEKDIQFLKGKSSIDTDGFDKILISLEHVRTSFSNTLVDLESESKKMKFLNDLIYELQQENFKISTQTNNLIKWLSRYKILVASLLAIFLLIVSGLLVKINTAPFQMNVGIETVKTISLHQEYPPLTSEAKMLFYFPNEVVERQITSLNEMIIPEVPSDLKGKKIKVKLEDKYWKVSDENFDIKRDASTITICPNESLSEIKGIVSDIFGNVLINAKVRFDDLSSDTDNKGKFNLQIPVEKRKIQYNIRIEMEGFISQWREYVTGTEIEIRLEKES